MLGASLSLTLTKKLVVVVLLSASVALHVAVVSPIANWAPDAGAQSTLISCRHSPRRKHNLPRQQDRCKEETDQLLKIAMKNTANNM